MYFVAVIGVVFHFDCYLLVTDHYLDSEHNVNGPITVRFRLLDVVC